MKVHPLLRKLWPVELETYLNFILPDTPEKYHLRKQCQFYRRSLRKDFTFLFTLAVRESYKERCFCHIYSVNSTLHSYRASEGTRPFSENNAKNGWMK